MRLKVLGLAVLLLCGCANSYGDTTSQENQQKFESIIQASELSAAGAMVGGAQGTLMQNAAAVKLAQAEGGANKRTLTQQELRQQLLGSANAALLRSEVSMMMNSPELISQFKGCKKWQSNRQKIINRAGLLAYLQVENICSLQGTPAFNLLILGKNTISGMLGTPVTYTDNTTFNFSQKAPNSLTKIKINSSSAENCEATLNIIPGATDLNKSPIADVTILDITCGGIMLVPKDDIVPTAEIPLTCTKYRFDSIFMRKYFGFINKCKAFSLPSEINLDTGTYSAGFYDISNGFRNVSGSS